MRASKDFEAVLQSSSLLDPEVEPEADVLMATGDAGPSSSKTEEDVGSKMVKHYSLKCQASESFEMPAGKGKTFKKLTGTPIEDAVAFLVISEKAITMTGISEGDLLIGKATKKSGKKGKQSIYRCQHCGYVTEQKVQGATHVRTEHLGHCLQCRLCSYCTFRSVDFKPHLTVKHPGLSTEWYEPLPDLSNIVAMEVDTKDIIIGVKEEPTVKSDSDSDSEEEEL